MKIAIVTGATKGIGLEIANQLVLDGYFVYGTYARDYDNEAIRRIENENLVLTQVPGENYEAVKSFITGILDKNQRIDVLVNNAGITDDTLLMRMTESSFDRVIDVNLKSVYNTCHHVIKPMIRQKFGRIINITSVVGLTGNIGQTNYAASKAGMIGFTKSLARECATRNITVNCIAPGFIETDMTQSLAAELKGTIEAQIPMRKMGAPKDVAMAVSFLVSEGASYITGQTLNIDGGMVI